MRILWVKIGGLWPLTAGGRLRTFHILAELSRRHRLTLVTTHGPHDDPDGLARALPGCEVISHPWVLPKRGTRGFGVALLRSWLSPLPVDVWKCRVPAVRADVARRFTAAGVDLAVADFLSAASNIPPAGRVPTVLFAHNVEHVLWRRLCQVEPRTWRRVLLELEWRKMRRYEAHACARAGLSIAVSDIDRRVLAAAAPGATVRAIPTGVDVGYFRPDGTGELPAHLVFTGSMDWYPNEDGVIDFVGNVLPQIRQQVPEASLTIVGRNPSRRLLAAAGEARVRVTGLVDDVRPFVAEAAVYVVPLRIGGGTRLKIFEALAMGKAVVSTTVGAEGLPLIPGTHFLRADDPADFARAVVSLLRDPGRRNQLGSAGRRLVEERYSWEQVAREFETTCAEVLTCASASSVWDTSGA